jgi:hypothetical protein
MVLRNYTLTFHHKIIMNINHIVLPDGSEYQEIYLSVEDLNNQKTAFHLEEIFRLKEGREIRLMTDNYLQSNLKSLLEIVQKNLGYNLKVKPWLTDFFVKEKQDHNISEQNSQVSWPVYENQGFNYSKISPTDQKRVSIIRDYMFGSFGHEIVYREGEKLWQKKERKINQIEKNFERSLDFEKNSIFLIEKGSLPVATYTIAKLENRNEIQFHSVAGKTFQIEDYKVKGKMNIILASLKDVFENYFPEISRLTFTCSKPKVSELYLAGGFELNGERRAYKFSD